MAPKTQTGNPLRIRPAIERDLKRISVMGVAFLRNSPAYDYMSFNSDKFYEMLTAMKASGILAVWVALDGDQIAGAVGMITTPNVYNHSELLSDIYFIDVVPEYRKKGLAKRLIATAEDYAKKIGSIAMTVSFNDEAIADRLSGYKKYEYKTIKSLR